MKPATEVVTDVEILAALDKSFRFVSIIVEKVYGRKLKAKSDPMLARLRKLEKAGKVVSWRGNFRGMALWRLPFDKQEIEARETAGACYDREHEKTSALYRDEWVHRHWQDFMPKPMKVIFGEPGLGKSYASRDQFGDMLDNR